MPVSRFAVQMGPSGASDMIGVSYHVVLLSWVHDTLVTTTEVFGDTVFRVP